MLFYNLTELIIFTCIYLSGARVLRIGMPTKSSKTEQTILPNSTPITPKPPADLPASMSRKKLGNIVAAD